MADSNRLKGQSSEVEELESGRYTMAEAARVKGVSYHTVSRAVRSGKLAARRLGRMALIDAGDLQAWQPMRERAPRKYRRDAGEDGSPRQRPTLTETVDADHQANRLTTAITTLHEGAATRTVTGFGDWLASLTASLLSLKCVVIWRLDEVTGRFVPYGSFGADTSRIPPSASVTAGEVMRHIIETGDVQRLDSLTLGQIGGDSWLPDLERDAVYSVSLRQGVRTVGLIVGVVLGGSGDLSEDDVRVAQLFGSQATIAIENVELRQSTRVTLEASPALFDDLPLQVMAIDRYGQLVYVNHEVDSQWGDVVRGKYVGRHYAHFVGMFRRERLDGTIVGIENHPFTRALRGEYVQEATHLVPGFFGTPRIFSMSANPLHDEDGAIAGAVLVSRDVTLEIQAKDRGMSSLQMLAAARRKVELLGALSSEIGQRENADDVFDIVAKLVCEALGADSSTIMTPNAEGNMVVRAIHNLQEGLLGRVLHRLHVPSSVLAMAQRELLLVSYDDAGPSGRELLAEGKAKGACVIPLLDGDDALGVVTVMFPDAAQLRRVDRDFAMAIGRQSGHAVHLRNVVLELEASRWRLLTVLDQLPQAVVMLDAPEGNIIAVNREAVALWGRTIEQLGLHGTDITMLDQDGRPLPGNRKHPLVRPLHTRETELGLPLMTQDASGQTVDVLVNIAPIIGRSGEVSGAVAVLQRRETFKPLEQAKDEFISVVAHELRNPLTSLRGNLQLLERRVGKLEDPKLNGEVERVRGTIEQADRVGELVSRMLDISRADLGKLTIDPGETDAVDLARGAIREVQDQAPDRQFTLEAPDALPVVWDRMRVQQILANLLTNAFRYAPDGDIETQVTVDDHDRVRISVRDHGPGVPPRLRRKLFRLYHRFDDGAETSDGLASRQRGLGIGLYISQRLAKAHGGELWVEDAEGGGARFTLLLPQAATSSD